MKQLLLKRLFCLTCLVAFQFVVFSPVVVADPFSNGDFSSGLAGWSVSDATSVTVNASNQAVINESEIDLITTLFQDFTVPANATSLDITLVSVETEQDGGGPPDALNISLLDPMTTASLVPTVDDATTAFYIRDLVTGVSSGEAASGVGQFPSSTELPLTITLDVAQLSGRDARLVFDLLGGGAASVASATIDGISINFVPEPSSFSIAILCSALLAQYGFLRFHR